MSSSGSGHGKARERTLAHLSSLLAAATALGVAEAGCKKELVGAHDDSAPDASEPTPVAVDSGAAPRVPPVAGPNGTAESTPDTTVFAGADAAARSDAGQRGTTPGAGYRVVDPMPTPTRIPRGSATCDPPYTIDANGRKHFKINCP